jgi:hypothetical protein
MQKHATELTCAWETLEYRDYTRFLELLQEFSCGGYGHSTGAPLERAGRPLPARAWPDLKMRATRHETCRARAISGSGAG